MTEHYTKPKHSPTQAQACAACKYQRRKCSKDCLLAPYFPSAGGNKYEDFMNVQKLFGVTKVSKLLSKVGLENRDEAVKSVVFEANARKADPVDGCYGILVNLMKQIAACEAELQMVMHQVTACRALAVAQNDYSNTEADKRRDSNEIGMKTGEEQRFVSESNQKISTARSSAHSCFAEYLLL